MIKVGLTGGIGSGKTTVCRVFELLGIPVYYADDRAKWLMNHDDQLIASIRETFGEESYRDGRLTRAYLAERVFNDEAQLAKLNALVHPAVLQDFDNWVKQQDAPYVIKEAALIFEAASDKHLDKVIVVTSPEEVRIQRIIQRDAVTRAAVLSRMKNQLPETEKVKRADFVIDNGGEVLVIPQVLKLHAAIGNRQSASIS